MNEIAGYKIKTMKPMNALRISVENSPAAIVEIISKYLMQKAN